MQRRRLAATAGPTMVYHALRLLCNGQVLERAAFAVKLSNGEFVCPSRLEAAFEQCASVGECCVLAAAGAESLLAVVVPKGVAVAARDGGGHQRAWRGAAAQRRSL